MGLPPYAPQMSARPQSRNQMMQQQAQQQMGQQQMGQQRGQYGSPVPVYNPNPSMMMTQQPLPSVGMRRSAAEMSGGMSHPNEPPGKRYRNVITNVSHNTPALSPQDLVAVKAC